LIPGIRRNGPGTEAGLHGKRRLRSVNGILRGQCHKIIQKDRAGL
jgi:hypothetical protein